MNGWLDVLREKASELSLIASWASQVGLGRVRDYCRNAECEVRDEIKRQEAMERSSE
jgi:hypothetical protein